MKVDCQSHGSSEVFTLSQGATGETLYESCDIQCSGDRFLTQSGEQSGEYSPFKDKLRIGFDKNGVFGVYTRGSPTVDRFKWGTLDHGYQSRYYAVDLNNVKCAEITKWRVRAIEVPTDGQLKAEKYNDCIDLASIQQILGGNFDGTPLKYESGNGWGTANVYRKEICPKAKDLLSYKLEIAFGNGTTYHIVGGFVGFKVENTETKVTTTWISYPFYLPITGGGDLKITDAALKGLYQAQSDLRKKNKTAKIFTKTFTIK
eukprot:495956_1